MSSYWIFLFSLKASSSLNKSSSSISSNGQGATAVFTVVKKIIKIRTEK